jgi:predicted RNase H-like nuclease (RuvC/YqgF family)
MTGTEQLPERVDRIERKLDALTESVDRRFDDVSEHFVEQRQYTEFAFDKLEKKLDANSRGLERLERKLDQLIAGSDRPPRRRRIRRAPKKR